MKKTLLTLFAFLMFGISVMIASEKTNVDPKILSVFQKEFSFAKNAKWEVKANLAQVNFLKNY